MVQNSEGNKRADALSTKKGKDSRGIFSLQLYYLWLYNCHLTTDSHPSSSDSRCAKKDSCFTAMSVWDKNGGGLGVILIIRWDGIH